MLCVLCVMCVLGWGVGFKEKVCELSVSSINIKYSLYSDNLPKSSTSETHIGLRTDLALGVGF